MKNSLQSVIAILIITEKFKQFISSSLSVDKWLNQSVINSIVSFDGKNAYYKVDKL